MTRLRLVLDTNVLLSALLFPQGSLTWIRESWEARAITPLATSDTTLELIRALSYPKFRLTDDELQDLLADYISWCETVTVSEQADIPDCRNPLDRPFLELALWANADALVTGDEDLLALKPAFSVPIMTPGGLRACLG